MRYQVEIEINKPLSKVVELFDNEENAFKWMEGLKSWDHLSGTAGEAGAKSKMRFKMKNREIEMVETIEEKNLPEIMTMNYTTKGVFNRVENRFMAIDDIRTKYVTDQEFKFESFGMKIMAFLMPGAFKKQSKKFLNDFKRFAESQD